MFLKDLTQAISPPGSLCIMFPSQPQTQLGGISGLITQPCVPRSGPLTGTGKCYQASECENTDPLNDPAQLWLHQPSDDLCVSPKDFPRARKDVEWLARELGLFVCLLRSSRRTGFSSCGLWALELRLSSCGAWA